MIREIKSIYRNDPAARGMEFILYAGFWAVLFHLYVAHPLYRLHLRFLSRFVSQVARFLTGIEIHPGARIGRGLFIDHGMGIVIGETSEIGNDCILFQGVTLGGTGKHRGKRHPTIGDRVLIGAHATLLGPIRVGNDVKIGAETVIINRDVPSDCTVVGAPGMIHRLRGEHVRLELPPSAFEDCRENLR